MKNLANLLSKHKAFVAISAFFFVLYSLLSLVNHFNFRTNAWDLGIFNQAIYQYAHLRLAPNTVNGFPSLLADHFEIVMILAAPFYYIFGSYTLLVFQILMTLFGAIGIYRYLNLKLNDQLLSLGGVLIFYCFYGLFAAILFDYHNNLTGIMFLPWILHAIQKNNKKKYYLFLALMILSKEPFALLAFFLGLYVAVFESGGWRKHGLITMFIGLTSFEIILSVIIPYFNNYQPYQHWVYGQIGTGPFDAVRNIVRHPLNTLTILFNDPIKANSLAMLGVTGGLIAILHPLAALLFIPLLAIKYFSSETNHWTYLYQYSVEFAPLLAICIPLVAQKLPGKLKYEIVTAFIFINIMISLSVPYNDWKRISDIFTLDFYYNSRTRDMRHALVEIPDSASVAAENNFVPHLANRDKIYALSMGFKDADYIIINANNQYLRLMPELNKFDKYQLFYKINEVEIYKKIPQ